MKYFHAHGRFQKLSGKAIDTFHRVIQHKGIESFCKKVESDGLAFSGRNVPVSTAGEDQYGFSLLIERQ